tara:strand:+ start:15388 stop:15651 length:264 start_codon:yes stop_codon:yes gene_type:complete
VPTRLNARAFARLPRARRVGAPHRAAVTRDDMFPTARVIARTRADVRAALTRRNVTDAQCAFCPDAVDKPSRASNARARPLEATATP